LDSEPAWPYGRRGRFVIARSDGGKMAHGTIAFTVYDSDANMIFERQNEVAFFEHDNKQCNETMVAGVVLMRSLL
jgi:hypothetical protein